MMKTYENLRIRSAKYQTDYVIRFTFSDGRMVDMDFHAWLSDAHANPQDTAYLDITRFKRFKVRNGLDVMWGDYELIFPLATLYAGDFRVDFDGVKHKGPQRLKAGRTVSAANRT